MKNFAYCLAVTAVLTSSCHGTSYNPEDIRVENIPTPSIQTTPNPYIINWHLSIENPREDFLTREIDSLQIVRLETTDASLLGTVSHMFLSGDTIVIVDAYKAHNICLFSKSGKFLRNIGGKGGGPGEFQSLSEIEMTKDSICVLDWLQAKRIAYSYEGGTANEQYWPKSAPENITYLNDSTFAASYASYQKEHPFALAWINQKDTTLNTALPIRYTRGKPAGRFLHTSEGQLLYYNSDNDTVYSVTEKSIMPAYTLGLSAENEYERFLEKTAALPDKEFLNRLYHNDDSPLNYYTIIETDNYWIVYFQKGPKSYLSKIDKTTNQASTYLRADIQQEKAYVPFMFYPAGGNTLIAYIDAAFESLISNEDKENFYSAFPNQDLKTIIEDYDPDDSNPIVCIFKLK